MNKHKKKHFREYGIVALAVALLISSSSGTSAGTILELDPVKAESVKLVDLIDGSISGIIVGDKLFDGFTYDTIGDVPSAENVNVIAKYIDGNVGLRFHGGFKDLFDAQNESSDALIGFNVSVTDPNAYLISDVHLAGNPSLSSSTSQNAYAEVVETVVGDFGALQLRIQEDLNGFVGSAWIDPLPWAVKKLRVTKDIQLLSIDGVRASVSYVDQTFSQEAGVVPEPATAILMFAGSLAMAGIRRRK